MKSTRHSHLRAVLQQRAPVPQFGLPHGSSHTGNIGNPGTGRGGLGIGNVGNIGDGIIFGGDDDDDDLPTGTSTASLPRTTLVDEPLVVSPTSTSTSRTSISTSSTQSPSSRSSSSSSSTSQASATALTTTVEELPIAQTTEIAAVKSSSTPSPQVNTSTSNSALIGGLGGGLVALVLIIFGIVFFLRRRRRNRDYLEAVAFRGSAMVQDPSTYADDRGLMSEKQPGLGSMYGVSAGSSPARSTFSAAQIINAPVSRFSDHATPMFGEFQEHYQAAQPYPVHYPFPSPYEQQAFSGHTSVQSSLPTQPPTPHDQYLSNDPTPRDSIPPDDFVDLTRSSVSPFQAAQYQAISEKLNAQVPILEDRALPPLPPPCADANPFNDPNTSADETNGDVSRSQSLSRQSVSGESIVAEALEFPLPPTPSQASITRYRVDSMPPMLPDINVQTRVSMNSMMGESQLGVPMPSKVPARSPLATSEIVPAPSPPEAAVVKTSQNDLSRFSIYNVEDVYGGC